MEDTVCSVTAAGFSTTRVSPGNEMSDFKKGSNGER